MPNLIVLSIAAAGSAILGGVFFAFSSFIMPALSRIPASAGVSAMQRINLDVYHWSFMGVFFLTPAISLWLVIHSALHWDSQHAAGIFAGGIIHLLGCFVVTAACNVPLNNSLAGLEPHAEATTSAWDDYQRHWTRWNHLRTLCCLVSSYLLIAELCAN